MIEVAAAAPSDLDAVRVLFRAYQAWLGLSLNFQDFEGELAALPGKYVPPRGALLLARADGAIAGVVALRPLEKSICEMKRLYVAGAFQRLGIGRVLTSAVIEAARAAGYRAMRLDTLASRMPAAVALYRGLGFVEIPAYIHNPEPDALYLELAL